MTKPERRGPDLGRPEWRRYGEPAGIVAAVLVFVALPILLHGWPRTLLGNVFGAALLASGLTLLWWRTRPRLTATAGGALWLAMALLGEHGWFPDTALPIMALLAATAALGWTGRAAWLVAACLAGYLVAFYLILGGSEVAVAMFSVPGYLAGTVLRQRREAADQLAERNRELEEERELFTDLALRHERARIAGELHDIVGHAISVMVIQAAAGQRLAEDDPERARAAFTAIAESARQGREDLGRLVDLLGGGEDGAGGGAGSGLGSGGGGAAGGAAVGGPDLALIDEVVTRAVRSGLDVSCRFEGDRDGVPAPAAHMAFRVVQESLTNALRHAPGAAVRVLVSGAGRDLTVSVENDPPTRERPGLSGTGRGLIGLRERVQELGGQLLAGPTPPGGWRVIATLGRRPA